MGGQRESQTVIEPAPEMSRAKQPLPVRTIAEYTLGEQIASGGMGAVHVGLKIGALGFRRLVAIKRLHAHLVQDLDFVARFKDEIRLVSRLTHPNVVQTLDVVELSNELALIMEFVDGVTLHELLADARQNGSLLPIPVAVGVLTQALHGLHAAHESLDDEARPLQLVHRDVSPQNLMISRVGLVKVLDFGIAKAATETHVTRAGQLSGKAAYMSPEQVLGRMVDRRTDIFAAGVVLWEALTGERLFRVAGAAESAALLNVLEKRVEPPSKLRAGISPELERVVLRALERDPARRFGSARDFALSLEQACEVGFSSDIAGSVLDLANERLARRATILHSFPESREATESGAVTAPDQARTSPRVAPPEPGQPTLALLSPELGTQAFPNMGEEAQTVDVQGVLVDEVVRGYRLPPRFATIGLGFLGTLLLSWLVLRGMAGERAGPARAREQLVPAVLSLSANSAVPVTPALSAPTFHTVENPVVHAPALELPTSLTSKRSESRRPAHTLETRKRPVNSARAEATRAPVSPRSDACSPPTYTDAEGIRHFKRECL